MLPFAGPVARRIDLPSRSLRHVPWLVMCLATAAFGYSYGVRESAATQRGHAVMHLTFPAPAGLPPRVTAKTALSVSAWVSGSGIYGAGVVTDERHVLTCLHVVDEMQKIEISIADRAMQPARVVDRDADLDLAVLEFD